MTRGVLRTVFRRTANKLAYEFCSEVIFNELVRYSWVCWDCCHGKVYFGKVALVFFVSIVVTMDKKK